LEGKNLYKKEETLFLLRWMVRLGWAAQVFRRCDIVVLKKKKKKLGSFG
jgi:hypothetical protein